MSELVIGCDLQSVAFHAYHGELLRVDQIHIHAFMH